MAAGEKGNSQEAAAVVSNAFTRLEPQGQSEETCFNSEFCIVIKNIPKGEPGLKTLDTHLLPVRPLLVTSSTTHALCFSGRKMNSGFKPQRPRPSAGQALANAPDAAGCYEEKTG